MTKPVVAVQMRGISKSFGGVKALDNVDFKFVLVKCTLFWVAMELENQLS